MLTGVDDSWKPLLTKAMQTFDSDYLDFLNSSREYIPSKERFLSVFFTMPKEKVKYILFGQDPYPRVESAIGYAFIDGAVEEIFSDTGLGKRVNRATSLRNFVKMALVADNRLSVDMTTQKDIAALDKTDMIMGMDELLANFEHNGVLLLNSALVFTDKQSSKRHLKEWRGFIQTLLEGISEQQPTLILFGAYAKEIKKLAVVDSFPTISMEHPYNHTFITNTEAHDLFGPMQLLRRRDDRR